MSTTDPTKRKARRLQKAMTARFLSEAPSYTWCRAFVLKTGNLAWSNWVHLEAMATGDWLNEAATRAGKAG